MCMSQWNISQCVLQWNNDARACQSILLIPIITALFCLLCFFVSNEGNISQVMLILSTCEVTFIDWILLHYNRESDNMNVNDDLSQVSNVSRPCYATQSHLYHTVK